MMDKGWAYCSRRTVLPPDLYALDVGDFCVREELSLSRLDHWLPRREAHPEVMQRTAKFHHQIADTLLPQAESVFDDATALHTTVDMLNPQPALIQGLVGQLLFQRQLLATRFLCRHKDVHLRQREGQ